MGRQQCNIVCFVLSSSLQLVFFILLYKITEKKIQTNKKLCMSNVKRLRERFTVRSLFTSFYHSHPHCYNNKCWLLLVLIRMNKLLATVVVLQTEVHYTQTDFERDGCV